MSLRRSIHILFSSNFFLVLAILVEPVVVLSWLPSSTNPILARLIFVFFMALKFYYFSGLYGMLVEISSFEEPFFSWPKFAKNMSLVWRVYLPVALVPIGLHLLSFLFFPQAKITLISILAFGDIIFSGLWAYLFVREKYFRSLSLRTRLPVLSRKDGLCLFLLFGLQVGAYLLSQTTIAWGWRVAHVPLAVRTYLHFLTFLFWVQILLKTYPQISKQFEHSPEIYLINPIGGGVLFSIVSQLLRGYPSWFLILRALTPARYHVREFHRLPWQPWYFSGGKLVTLSCFTFNSAEAYQIAKGFRQRGSTVIMGGPHVSAFPDEALEYCDSVVIGEAEGVWEQVITDYETGALRQKYYPQDNEEAFRKVQKYLMAAPPVISRDCLETTRGCKYRCEFCAVPRASSGGGLRKKPLADILNLLKKIREKFSFIIFLDNNVYSDPTYARQFLAGLRPFRFSWAGSISIDVAQNEKDLALLKASGCRTLLIGYEVSSPPVGEGVGGKFKLADRYVSLTRRIQKMGIGIKAHFILGFDFDTLRSLWDMWWLSFRLRAQQTGVSILTPLPGSAFFLRALAEGKIRSLNWRNYNCQKLVITPGRLPTWVLLQPVYSVLLYLYITTTTLFGLGLLAVSIWLVAHLW